MGIFAPALTRPTHPVPALSQAVLTSSVPVLSSPSDAAGPFLNLAVECVPSEAFEHLALEADRRNDYTLSMEHYLQPAYLAACGSDGKLHPTFSPRFCSFNHANSG